jgi:hypothetical protein
MRDQKRDGIDVEGLTPNVSYKPALGPLAPDTVLHGQPLARVEDLQPGRLHHDVHRPANLPKPGRASFAPTSAATQS